MQCSQCSLEDDVIEQIVRWTFRTAQLSICQCHAFWEKANVYSPSPTEKCVANAGRARQAHGSIAFVRAMGAIWLPAARQIVKYITERRIKMANCEPTEMILLMFVSSFH